MTYELIGGPNCGGTIIMKEVELGDIVFIPECVPDEVLMLMRYSDWPDTNRVGAYRHTALAELEYVGLR